MSTRDRLIAFAAKRGLTLVVCEWVPGWYSPTDGSWEVETDDGRDLSAKNSAEVKSKIDAAKEKPE